MSIFLIFGSANISKKTGKPSPFLGVTKYPGEIKILHFRHYKNMYGDVYKPKELYRSVEGIKSPAWEYLSPIFIMD